jgi:hypothetical protein
MRVVGDLFEAPHELLLELDVVRVPGDVALRVLDGLRGAEQPDDLLLPRANELLSLQGAYFDRLVALGASPSRRGALRLNPSPIAAVPDELDVLSGSSKYGCRSSRRSLFSSPGFVARVFSDARGKALALPATRVARGRSCFRGLLQSVQDGRRFVHSLASQ